MRRHLLSKKDVRKLINEVDSNIAGVLKESETVELYEIDDSLTIFIVDGKPLFAKIRTKIGDNEVERYIPLITMFYIRNVDYPYVRVDEGAVPRILNGADVMRPGIREISGDFEKGDVVAVRDPKNRTIAVTLSLYSRREIESMQKGKVLKNVHYLGDKISKICSELTKK
ncbi:MAG: DUF1947 domain-containing protein [Crenarchaeota archaeon]|nr:DUF1947 domain-containing protein [Thermoproteota archaeon]